MCREGHHAQPAGSMFMHDPPRVTMRGSEDKDQKKGNHTSHISHLKGEDSLMGIHSKRTDSNIIP